MTPDLSQCLVAYAGEVITCPECGAELATFTADASAADMTEMSAMPMTWHAAAQRVRLARGSVMNCVCGGIPGRSGSPGALPGWETPTPQLFLRSGAWTGWRDLGGE